MHVLSDSFIIKNERNYFIGVTYVGTEGTDGVSAGAEADPHDVERAIPAAAAMIDTILTSFILFYYLSLALERNRPPNWLKQ